MTQISSLSLPAELIKLFVVMKNFLYLGTFNLLDNIARNMRPYLIFIR